MDAAIQTLGETVATHAHCFHSDSRANGSASQATCGGASNSCLLAHACALVTAGPPYNAWMAGVVRRSSPLRPHHESFCSSQLLLVDVKRQKLGRAEMKRGRHV